ncbi:WD40 repeat domain-containing protein [Nocardiopsis halotolerans]|uniref:WD40 repeat domain-containing protein n=1 Tax=Nocardiopsis halotolerans TaxID=124252 RepID=UPI00034AB248|nr:hypothetical protein [Nocardiopsis halotolerans]
MRPLTPEEPSGVSRRRPLMRVAALVGVLVLLAGAGVYSVVTAPSWDPTADTADGGCSASGGSISASLAPTEAPRTTFAEDAPIALSFSPDNSLLAVSQLDAVTLWDWRESRALARIDHDSSAVPPTPVTFSPDGCLAAYGTQDGAVVMDLETGRKRTVGAKDTVRAVAFSPDGSSLALGVDGDPDGQFLHLHDTGSWKLEARLPGSGVLGSIRYSLDGTVVAGGEDDGGIAVWNVLDRSLAGLIRDRSEVGASAFDILPDGSRLLVIRSGSVVLVDRETGAVIREFTPDDDGGILVDVAYSAASGRVFAARLDPATGRDDMVAWTYASATEVALGPDLPHVFPMALSWDGSRVAGLRKESGDIAVYDTELSLLDVIAP